MSCLEGPQNILQSKKPSEDVVVVVVQSLGWKAGFKKAGWKLNIQKMNIMASGPITSWQMGRNWRPTCGVKRKRSEFAYETQETQWENLSSSLSLDTN